MPSCAADPFVSSVLTTFDPIRHHFVEIVINAFPGAEEDAVLWSSYFLNSSLSLILTEGGGIDRLSQDRIHSAELEVAIDRMAPFFAVGFECLIRASEESDEEGGEAQGAGAIGDLAPGMQFKSTAVKDSR